MKVTVSGALRDSIAQWASRLPNSTITGVRLDPNFDTWAVMLTEKLRPCEIIVGLKDQEKLSASEWPRLAMHESAHSSATFFTPVHQDVSPDLAHQVNNVLEDIRIDLGIQKMFPGLVPNYEHSRELWRKNYLPKIEEYHDGKMHIKSADDILTGIILFKFMGVAETRKNVEFASVITEVKLKNEATRQLNLKNMWEDLADTVTGFAAVQPKFTGSLAERKSANRAAVVQLNAWFDKYAWVFRNQKEQSLKDLLEMLKSANPGAISITMSPGGVPVKLPMGPGPGQAGEGLEKLPDLGKEKTVEEQIADEIERLTEGMPGPSVDLTEKLGEWTEPSLLKRMLTEVRKEFPIQPPRPRPVTSSVKNSRRQWSEEGVLSAERYEDYIINNRPRDYKLHYTREPVSRQMPPMFPNPPRGHDFPTKRIALFLDLSGSMTDAIKSMVAFTQAFAAFAKEHKVEMQVVVGDTGVATLKPGDYAGITKMLMMPRGNGGNSPTWKVADMQSVMKWVGKDGGGKAIFVTDMAIQENEIVFINECVASKHAILVQDKGFNISKIADKFWQRPGSLSQTESFDVEPAHTPDKSVEPASIS